MLTDKQYVTEQDMVISHGPLPRHAADQSLQGARARGGAGSRAEGDGARLQARARSCKLGNKLFVAMADPLNVLALDDLRQRTKLEIVPMITTERAVTEALSGVNSAGAAMDRCCKDAAADEARERRGGEGSDARRSISTGSRSRARTRRSSRSSTSSSSRRSRKRRSTFTSSRSRSSSSCATAWTAP